MLDIIANPQDRARLKTRPRVRSRASSLLSVASSAYPHTISIIAKSPSTSAISHLPSTHEAYGSFIPVRSAAGSLKDFASCASPPISFPVKRRRKVTFDDKCYYSPSYDNGGSCSASASRIPYITRTTHVTPPSPTSSTASLSPPMSPVMTPKPDLHPVLARLEQTSRFRSEIMQCSTCQKQGSDFPRCPKCGNSWCSRSCRLVGGKRHVCSGST